MPLDRFERKLRRTGMAYSADDAAMAASGNVAAGTRVGFLHVARGKNLLIEYGNGAAQINVVSKSGTNQLHFTLFEFLRNDKLQARNFFDGSRKPALRRNQYGATVGGPVLIPKLYNGRNRTFWLFNFDSVRQRNPNTLLSSLPTQAELDGDLSGVAGGITDPAAGTPFPGGRIPAARFDPTARAYRRTAAFTGRHSTSHRASCASA
jgi:hypothetical protein